MYSCVRANQDLFDRWTDLTLQLGQLKAIVQNDIDITQAEFVEWFCKSQELSMALSNLIVETGQYIMESQCAREKEGQI